MSGAPQVPEAAPTTGTKWVTADGKQIDEEQLLAWLDEAIVEAKKPLSRWQRFRWWLVDQRWRWFSVESWRYRLGDLGWWLYARYALADDPRYKVEQYLSKHDGKWPARGVLAGSVFDESAPDDDDAHLDEGVFTADGQRVFDDDDN